MIKSKILRLSHVIIPVFDFWHDFSIFVHVWYVSKLLYLCSFKITASWQQRKQQQKSQQQQNQDGKREVWSAYLPVKFTTKTILFSTLTDATLPFSLIKSKNSRLSHSSPAGASSTDKKSRIWKRFLTTM